MSCSYPFLLLSKDVFFSSVATTIFANSFTVFTTTKLLHVMFITELRNLISASNSFNTLKMSPHHRLLARHYLEWLKSCHKIVCGGTVHFHPLDGDVSFINFLEHLRSNCFNPKPLSKRVPNPPDSSSLPGNLLMLHHSLNRAEPARAITLVGTSDWYRVRPPIC